VAIVPEPETSITCGLVDALSTIETVPAKVPCVVGVMLRLQDAPGATLLPHVELTLYGFVAVVEETDSVVVPLFVSEADCDVLVVPTN
jgi:hypothetical protein